LITKLVKLRPDTTPGKPPRQIRIRASKNPKNEAALMHTHKRKHVNLVPLKVRHKQKREHRGLL
jgi:hypothetical protein